MAIASNEIQPENREPNQGDSQFRQLAVQWMMTRMKTFQFYSLKKKIMLFL